MSYNTWNKLSHKPVISPVISPVKRNYLDNDWNDNLHPRLRHDLHPRLHNDLHPRYHHNVHPRSHHNLHHGLHPRFNVPLHNTDGWCDSCLQNYEPQRPIVYHRHPEKIHVTRAPVRLTVPVRRPCGTC